MPLPTSGSNIVEMPGYHFSVRVYIETVLCDAHGLDPGMQYIIYKEYVNICVKYIIRLACRWKVIGCGDS